MEYLSKGPEAQTYVQIKEHKINALALKEKKQAVAEVVPSSRLA